MNHESDESMMAGMMANQQQQHQQQQQQQMQQTQVPPQSPQGNPSGPYMQQQQQQRRVHIMGGIESKCGSSVGVGGGGPKLMESGEVGDYSSLLLAPIWTFL